MLNTMENIKLSFTDPANLMVNNFMDGQATLTYALKAATQAIYTSIEQSTFNQAIEREELVLPLYISQLEVYLPVYRALERHCQQDEPLHQIWHEKMIKTSLLETDLACVQTEMLNARVQRMTMDFMQFVNQTGKESPLKTLGILYALEKLSLIHYHLLPHIQNMYNLQTKGVTFYRSYDSNLYQQWYAFKQRLDTVDVSILDQPEVITGAIQTFERVEILLSNLWKLRTLYQEAV
ncbi:biliverdin-producing heme oxygenase [Candidatus Albibeggiatoa sp. nov. BB20]|uniref:biliverdin-producing heme oxygenase n=1 Tax=Candidatus Albibeggiatoa sp. nov. BB20 TaxID=3162723 RepID=UPI00336586B0